MQISQASRLETKDPSPMPSGAEKEAPYRSPLGKGLYQSQNL